jgi:asparagine synthase (glutamine-hydrolysing)
MSTRAARPQVGGVWGAPSLRRFLAPLARALGPGARLVDPAAPSPALDADGFTDAEASARAGVVPCAGALPRADGGLDLVRDRLGHRALYAVESTEGVVFASTPHALVAAGAAEKRLSRHALALYLSCAYVPGATTLVEGVRALLGGERRRYDRAGRCVEVTRHDLPPSPPRYDDEGALTPALRADLEAAVRRRLPRAGAPIAATLSGGIDSSAVVALARRLHDGPLTALSVWFGAAHAHELDWSRLVATHVGAPHVVVEVAPGDVETHFDATVAALAEPNGDPLTVPNTLLFRAAAAHAEVLFNGEGGDPCFGGPKNAPMLLATLLDDPTSTPAAQYLRAHQRLFDELERALGGDVDRAALEAEVAPALVDPRWPGFLDRLMALNVTWKGAHHILPKIDRLSAPWGVTPASPLFDAEVVARAFTLPGELKRRGADEKYLLKRAVADLLPQAILERPKSGMMVPVEAWFGDGGPLAGWALERLRALPPPLDARWAVGLLQGPRRGLRPRRGVKVWLLLTFEAWWRQLGGA